MSVDKTTHKRQSVARPILAITLGDPAGVGPECIVRAWSSGAIHAACRPFVVGNLEVVRRAAARFAPELVVREISTPAALLDDSRPTSAAPPALPCSAGEILCLPAGSNDAAEVAPSVVDPRGGQAAYDALCLATRLALAGEVAGLVTAPLHKEALHLAGHHYPGHTELLGEMCGVREFAMMLYLGPGEGIVSPAGLGVAHVTLHRALRDVGQGVTTERVASAIRLAQEMMSRLGAGPARIGVCAMNPHAGEAGLFGDEESRLIAPAVSLAQSEGIHAQGPFPADTLFVRARDGLYDGVVAMYHDQGHIALKLLGMHRAVNITVGLPIVRTSVAHGTAFDLAWQGRAETRGLVEAILTAARLAMGDGQGRDADPTQAARRYSTGSPSIVR